MHGNKVLQPLKPQDLKNAIEKPIIISKLIASNESPLHPQVTGLFIFQIEWTEQNEKLITDNGMHALFVQSYYENTRQILPGIYIFDINN